MIYAGRLSDGRIQVWATQSNGQLQSRWKETTNPDSGWTGWSAFQTPEGGVNAMSGSQLEDGRLQIFATGPSGSRWSCWKTNTNPDSAWTKWSAF